MDLQYYLQYIITWVYHNVINTGATLAIVRILIIIGLVSLLVYQQYILFVLLCIIVISAEFLILDETASTGIKDIFSFETNLSKEHRIVDKDELTTGVSLAREGFSLGLPKIIKGDDSGKDYQRPNKFIEEDSRDFTEKYFTSKQCSIGSGVGSITMFGDNELIGDSRTAKIHSVYDFAGNWVPATDAEAGPPAKAAAEAKARAEGNKTQAQITEAGNAAAAAAIAAAPGKRFIYFKDCVYDPIKRNDFRAFKKEIYSKINAKIIDIPKCLARFNTGILFNTRSNITANRSEQITLSGENKGDSPNISYVSMIKGSTNTVKLDNIQPLDKGNNSDNASDTTYSQLMKETTDSKSGMYEKESTRTYMKERAVSIYGKVFGYRARINDILKMMREQTKDDATLMHTVRISESIVNELRTMLAYLSIIQKSNNIIEFELNMVTTKPIYDQISTAVTGGTFTLGEITGVTEANKATISGDVNKAATSSDNNIYLIPLDDNTYNTKDEQRYLYGITYYFDKTGSDNPYPSRI